MLVVHHTTSHLTEICVGSALLPGYYVQISIMNCFYFIYVFILFSFMLLTLLSSYELKTLWLWPGPSPLLESAPPPW